MTDDKTDEYGSPQFSAGDILKRNTVQQFFKCFDDACKKQEPISDESHDSSFTKRVNLVEGLLLKYTPDDIKNVIKDLRTELEKGLDKIENDNTLNERNKLLTKRTMNYEYNLEILKLLAVVLTNSPISVEYVEMEITSDYKDLIKNIRQADKIKLFTEVT